MDIIYIYFPFSTCSKFAHNSIYFLGVIEYKSQRKCRCGPLNTRTKFTTLREAKDKCAEDLSCGMIDEYKHGNKNDYIFCPPAARLIGNSSTDETVYVKNMKGNI